MITTTHRAVTAAPALDLPAAVLDVPVAAFPAGVCAPESTVIAVTRLRTQDTSALVQGSAAVRTAGTPALALLGPLSRGTPV